MWRKGHTEILEDENVWKFVPTLYRRSDVEFVLNLQIYTLEEGDFGLYTCEAKNQYGNSSSTVLIEGKHNTFYIIININIRNIFNSK